MKRIVFPLLVCLSLVSCAKQDTFEGKFVGLFNSYVNVTTYQGSDENIQELKGIFTNFSKETDNYLESDVNSVYTLNHTAEPVTVSNELYSCLQKSVTYNDQITPYFNPLVGSLSKLWKEKLEENLIPEESQIQSELSKIHSSSLLFGENNSVTKTGEAEIDLGAIAKGYALDLCASYFVSKGITQYIVDAGSSSILLGEKNTNDGLFTIKIKDLTQTFIKAKNTFVSTSSIREQFKVIDNVLYSHIVNPETGTATPIHDTVVVLSNNGALGDALSTAMMMMSLPEIYSFEAEYNVKTIVIKNKQVVYSHQDIEFFH